MSENNNGTMNFDKYFQAIRIAVNIGLLSWLATTTLDTSQEVKVLTAVLERVENKVEKGSDDRYRSADAVKDFAERDKRLAEHESRMGDHEKRIYRLEVDLK